MMTALVVLGAIVASFALMALYEFLRLDLLPGMFGHVPDGDDE